MLRRFLVSALLLVCLLVALVTGGCGDEAVPGSSDLTSGHRAELISFGGFELGPTAARVTFWADEGQLKIIADVVAGGERLSRGPSLRCALLRLRPGGAGSKATLVPLRMTARPEFHQTIYVLHTVQPLEAGTYRLTYRGHGGLAWMRIGTQY